MKIERSRTEWILGRLSRHQAGPLDPGSPDWELVFRRSLREKTAGLLAANVKRLGLPVPMPVRAGMEVIHNRLLAVHVLRSHDLSEVRASLDGLPFIVFKGLDLIERAYREAGVRDMGDIDLIVPRARFEEACARLSERGWSSGIPASEALRVASGGSKNSLLLYRGDRTPIHMHWHFANASLRLPYADIPESEIFRHSVDHALDSEATYVILCEHAMKHSFSALLYLSDISAAWTGLRPDAPAVIRLAREWGLETPVRFGSLLARELLGTPIDESLVRTPRGAEARIFLRRVMSGRRADGLSALGYLSMHPDLRAKWSFLRSTFLPSEGDMRLYGKRRSPVQLARRLFRGLSLAATSWRAR